MNPLFKFCLRRIRDLLLSSVRTIGDVEKLNDFNHFIKNSKVMAKEKFERTKPHVNIGTIGHVLS